MKKLLAFIMCVALLATTGVIFASADGPVTENFSPVGELTIEWDPEIADKIELDGDISDWLDTDFTANKITTDNLIGWQNTEGAVDEDFEINAYFVSDSEFLYIAFWIVDNDFVPSTNSGDYHDGDAFQIAIDFNHEMKKILEEDPDMLENAKNIFYSFDCITEGDFVFYRNERLVNQPTELISEAEGDGVKGAGAGTENGWCAEFALSWDMLYEDVTYKGYMDDYTAILDKNNSLQLGVTLCYIDMGEAGMTSAAGTFKEIPNFTPAENGMSLVLEWAEGVTIDCNGILTPEEGEEYVTVEDDGDDEETTEPEESSSAAEESSSIPEESSSEPEESTAAPEESSSAAETEAKTDAPKAEKKGCGSVVATGAAVAVLAAAAAAVALKKKD